jgi:multiple sugar transport system permease protein
MTPPRSDLRSPPPQGGDAGGPAKPDPRRPLSSGRFFAWAALCLMLFVTLAPLAVMLRTAVEHPNALLDGAHRVWPQEPSMVNFRRVLGGLSHDDSLALGGSGAEVDFLAALGRSLVFTALVVVLQTTSCAMAAYAFARLRFAGRRVLFAAFMASMMLPGVVLFIPNFILIRDLGWLNSMAGMVAPFALMSGFSIFFLRQFFLALPRDLEEAATLDGASPWLAFRRIVLPLNLAPLATVAMLTGINAWNEFFWPFIVAPGEEHQLLPVALQSFKAQSPQGQVDWTGLMAASTVALLPTLVLLLAAGRKVVESVQFSGGK